MNSSSSRSGKNHGQSLRAAAFVLLEAKRECYIRESRRALLSALLANNVATDDDVREQVELLNRVDPKVVDIATSALVHAGIIRHVRHTTSKEPEAHKCQASVWELANATAAEQWLVDHPPIPPLKTGIDLLKSETPTATFAERRTVRASKQTALLGFDSEGSL